MHRWVEFIQNHWLLWLALVAVVLMIIYEELRHRRQRPLRLSPQDLTHKLNKENAVVIDLRDATAFASGHIVGAINIPRAELADNLTKLDKYKGKTIVLVCQDGRHSLAAALKWRRPDLSLYALQGGINNWRSANLPLVKK
ncbi:MAG: rhodanese-like domain-containing protein [Coxiellaceae bacterium]|nr:MAG: rhodanese-like domain-containing protein [Coxiellaceae bacterium]